tara:strand:+ start:341 stop:580 length:240 start_codon:yes stop_codon:yes gene_type:complete
VTDVSVGTRVVGDLVEVVRFDTSGVATHENTGSFMGVKTVRITYGRRLLYDETDRLTKCGVLTVNFIVKSKILESFQTE